ncbi:hypothetical protein BH23BAC2_BH23BAC2_24470 [soil metagenome]
MSFEVVFEKLKMDLKEISYDGEVINYSQLVVKNVLSK